MRNCASLKSLNVSLLRRPDFQRYATSLNMRATHDRDLAMAAGPHLARIRKARSEMRKRTLILLSLVFAVLAGCKEGDSGGTEPPPGSVTHQVSVTVTGPGAVEDSANGIDCAATCNYTIAQGRVLNLTQLPEAGAHFTSWSGDCPAGEQCSISVTGPLDIGATFATDDPPPPPGTQRVTLTITGPGTVEDTANDISCDSTCSYNLRKASC